MPVIVFCPVQSLSSFLTYFLMFSCLEKGFILTANLYLIMFKFFWQKLKKYLSINLQLLFSLKQVLYNILIYQVLIYIQMDQLSQGIQERAKSLSQQCSLAQENYLRVSALTDAANQQKNQVEAILREDLSAIRSSLAAKVSLINQVYEHYQVELEVLERGRKYQPATGIHPILHQISQFSLEMNNLLKFESLSKKKARMEADYLTACNKLKDEVKKVKLKISLTELEINEAQKKSAKKSVKF